MKTKRAKSAASPSRPSSRSPKASAAASSCCLIHSVEHVGKQGQVVEVKPGYAYNYLIPQGLATLASDHHKRMVEKHKVKLQQIELARQAELRKQAAELAKQSITIEANATEDGHLYGSVGAARNRGRAQEPTTSTCRPTKSASKARSRNSACTRSKFATRAKSKASSRCGSCRRWRPTQADNQTGETGTSGRSARFAGNALPAKTPARLSLSRLPRLLTTDGSNLWPR